jgi:hypothetical protein
MEIIDEDWNLGHYYNCFHFPEIVQQTGDKHKY